MILLFLLTTAAIAGTFVYTACRKDVKAVLLSGSALALFAFLMANLKDFIV